MRKLFVFSDVHGFYDELMSALNSAGFNINNKDHVIVSCGDLMDRGPKPLSCLRFVNGVPDDRKILIRGNHEDLLDDCLDRKEFLYHDYHNGTSDTVCDLGDYGLTTWSLDDTFKKAERNPEWVKYRKSLVDYAEVGNNIFVHGWISCGSNDPNMYHAKNIIYTFQDDWRNGDWKRARWINGMDAWQQGVKIKDKTIFMGHWHCSYGNSKIHKIGPEWDNLRSTNPEHRKAHFEPFVDDGIVALDACTCVSHKVNVFVIDVEE